MLTFVDEVQSLDQEAKPGVYQLMILSINTVDGTKLTMYDGASEFELDFYLFGDKPQVDKYYYCLIDVANSTLHLKQLQDEPVRETVKQFMALCNKHQEVFN